MNSTGSPDEPAPAAEPGPQDSAWNAIRFDPYVPRAGPERQRLAISLLVSLLLHLPLLNLIFGGDGQGLPGFNLPWQARRTAVPDLIAVLMPKREATPEPVLTPVADPMPPARVEPPAVAVKVSPPTPPAAIRERETATIAMGADPNKEPETAAPAANATTPVERPADAVPVPVPEPPVIAVTQPEIARWVVPPAPETPAPVIAEAPRVASPETTAPLPDKAEATRARVEQEARERAAEQARLEREKQEAQRQAEQREAARQETARQEAARQETARQEAARQEAARQEAARQEAARQEAARQAAARQESARQEAARQEAAKLSEAREAEAKREERLRALGRQLDAEAAKREAASRLPHSVSSARRGRLYGRSDANEELARYGETFARKIQMNMTLNLVGDAAKRPHVNPVVTTAVRSDGSVESISFVVSSGVPELDEAVRRIVRSQEHYPAFPPALAREYDVIEIRRTWHFDVAVRLH